MLLSTIERQKWYQVGIVDEMKVIKWIASNPRYDVRVATNEENRDKDIDCWVNENPVSIKSQHKGVSWHNIGFELACQLTAHKDCQLTSEALQSPLSLLKVDELVNHRSWEYSWFYSGQASSYIFYQGDKIRLYHKKDIITHVEAKGFAKIRPLSSETKSYLGGIYRHCNSICGYLFWNEVPHRIWNIND